MAYPTVDNLHQSLRQFAERTNDLVCSANNRLEFLVNNHHPSVLNNLASSSSTTAATPFRLSKRPRIQTVDEVKPAPSSPPRQHLLRLSHLPVEILDSIFLFFTSKQLVPLLLTNKLLFSVSQRRLYHTVHLNSTARCLPFLKTVQANPRLAPLVRNVDLNVSTTLKSLDYLIPSEPSPQSTSPSQLTANFYRLLAEILRGMSNLSSLTLELPKADSPVWIFDGCTFKLRQFTTSMHCHRPLARFLESQEGIQDLTLRGFQSENAFLFPILSAAAALANAPPPAPGLIPPSTQENNDDATFHLSPSALPRLRHFNAIHAGPNIVRAIMHGRPIEVASLPLFPDTSMATLQALESGSIPLRRLSIISFDPGAPEFLFEQLARRFRGLEALHLVMLMADYTKALLEESGRLLANFTALKYITFMAASSEEASTIDEGAIAKEWHRSCPTLRTIILPKGRVWFQGDIQYDVKVEDATVLGALI